MDPLVSFVLATCNRRDLLSAAIDSVLAQEYSYVEIVVVSNGSTDGTRDLFSDGAKYDRDCIEFYHYDEQLGVSEARNVGYRKASGDILVTIDDDAVLANADATGNVVSEFEADDDVGILSFKIVNQHTQQVESDKIPSRDDTKSGDEPFQCAYFLGGGNAIRAEVFETVGYYPSDFTYSFEELDLSYRALDAGFDIKYVPSVVVIHKAEPKSEGVAQSVLEQYLTNRIKVAVRNLPWRYAVVSSLIWTAYTLYRARFDPRPAAAAIYAVVQDRRNVASARNVIDAPTVERIRRRDGRLWM